MPKMNEKLKQWHQEAVEAALAKKNSALPLNRRARTTTPTRSGDTGSISLYHRGTVTLIGHMEVTL